MDLPIRRRARRDPAVDAEFDRLRPALTRDLERWPDFVDRATAALRDVVPQADVEERDDAYVVDVELPGVRRDDISVEVSQGRLTVTGERRERARVGLLRHRSRTTGRFRLSIALPSEVDGDAVTATLDHGVLTVVVPKPEHARRRRIPVRHRG
jgi:HSP20 family protein